MRSLTLLVFFTSALAASGLAAGPARGACPPVVDCRGPAFAPATHPTKWARKRNTFFASGHPHHRSRDQLLVEGEPQWVLAKFTYGPLDKDLKGEPVDIWLRRGCEGGWVWLGVGETTREDGLHPPVAEVVDKGGQIFFPIPEAQRLGVGLHRVQLVVRGDRSRVDAWIQVLPRGAEVVISDIDGTLTVDADAEMRALLRGRQPGVRPGAAPLLRGLQARGFAIYYLSSRPDWLTTRSHQWLRANGFPPGVVHTALSKLGELKIDPAAYKTAQVARLRARGLVPALAFGDRETDARAWRDGGVPARYLIGLTGADHGGVRFDDYRALAPQLAGRAAACP